MEKDYIEIGGRQFYIKKLTLGQTDELCEHFGIKIKELDVKKFSEIVQESVNNACTFFAIVLNEKDVELSDKDIPELVKLIKYGVDEDKLKEMLDFFLTHGKEIWNGSKKGTAKIHTLPKKK